MGSDNQDFLSILILLGLVASSFVAINMLDGKSKEKDKTKNTKTQEDIKDKIKERLENDTKIMKEKAVRFYIVKLISGYKFSTKEEDEIIKQYPQEFATPRLPNYNDLYGSELSVFYEILKEKIKNYNKKTGLLPKDVYQNMILKEAEEEAKRILNDYKQKFRN